MAVIRAPWVVSWNGISQIGSAFSLPWGMSAVLKAPRRVQPGCNGLEYFWFLQCCFGTAGTALDLQAFTSVLRGTWLFRAMLLLQAARHRALIYISAQHV